MKKGYQSLMAALFWNVLIVSMHVFFLPDVSGSCSSHLSITGQKEIEALNGSCLIISCKFEPKDGEASFNIKREIFGVWFKTGTAVFNSSGTITTYRMNITGNLTEKNCTTLFSDVNTSHQDKYFFRIMNWPFRATASCDPLQIIVNDSPWSPSINIPVDLKEHQSVTISCSALTPCPHSPPELTWSLQQDSHRQTEKNTEGTFTTKIQETITLSDTHDGYNISCSATYPVNGVNKTADTEVTLSVSYAPKDTSASISPSGLVSAGSWVELSCSSRAKPPASFTWFRNSKHGAIKVSVGQVYSFNATEGGEYYCVATNDLGHQRSVVLLRFKGILNGPLFWLVTALAIGFSVIICLVVFVRCVKTKQPTLQQTQAPTGEESIVQTPSKVGEELHYGEVTFFKRKPKASSISVTDSEQEEMVYAQVRVPKSKENPTQKTDSPADLYAQVNKK